MSSGRAPNTCLNALEVFGGRPAAYSTSLPGRRRSMTRVSRGIGPAIRAVRCSCGCIQLNVHDASERADAKGHGSAAAGDLRSGNDFEPFGGPSEMRMARTAPLITITSRWATMSAKQARKHVARLVWSRIRSPRAVRFLSLRGSGMAPRRTSPSCAALRARHQPPRASHRRRRYVLHPRNSSANRTVNVLVRIAQGAVVTP
jgi:hypothetical protein